MRDEESTQVINYASRLGKLETHVAALETTIDAVAEGQKLLFSKVDSVIGAVQGLSANSGKIPTTLILTLVGVVTPLAGLSITLLMSHMSAKNEILSGKIEAVEKAALVNAADVDEITARNAQFIEELTNSRWRRDDHDRFIDNEFLPLVERERATSERLARLEERCESAKAAQKIPPLIIAP